MREILNMNFNWKYHYGDIKKRAVENPYYMDNPQWLKAGINGIAKSDYDDSNWEDINLPHDFVIEKGEYSEEINSRVGNLVKGVAWYRKAFKIPITDEGKCLSLEFDGVFRNCQVWVNGFFLGRILSGYQSFSFDFSDVANYGGTNVVAVFVDATEYEGWWYEGGGIYRDVRLVKTNTLHIPQWGTYVYCAVDKIHNYDIATVYVETEVKNDSGNNIEFQLCCEIEDKNGNIVSQNTIPLSINSYTKLEFKQQLEIKNPILWSLDSPYLYTINSVLKKDGEVLDNYTTTCGIRTIDFDADKGFLLNGKQVKIKGVCCHEDHAGVGVAVPKAINEYRINRLKEMGCNAYRTSHNPPTPEILDICDRMGMLVMVENREMGSANEYLKQLKTMIKRDRNHPAVVLWSLGNEEHNVQGKKVGVRVINHMMRIVKNLDTTRPITYALNEMWAKHVDFHEENGLHFDVQGFNYCMLRHWDSYDKLHAKYPNDPIIGTENIGNASTRGLYKEEIDKDNFKVLKNAESGCIWTNKKREGLVSAYGETFPCWGSTPEETWKVIAERSFVSGLFAWTGFDYRGETYPYEWPCVISSFGIMDLCGFAKDSFYYYKSQWTNKPVLHIFPHWNWEGYEGQDIDIWAYTNMDYVEMFLNEESQGKKEVPRHGHVEWTVKYTKGKVTAIGYKNGEKLLIKEIETTNKPYNINLHCDRTTINNDNQDVCVVNVSVTDDKGRFVPTADNKIEFSITNNARIIGVGNGNPVSHEHDKEPYRKLYHGLCQVLIQSTRKEGKIILTAKSEGLKTDKLYLNTVKVKSIDCI